MHWCLDCRSALAEAEVEYEERTSPAIDVRFDVVDRAELRRRLGVARHCPTLPRKRRDLDDDAVDAAGEPGRRGASGVRVFTARGRRRRGRGARASSQTELADQRAASRAARRQPQGRARACRAGAALEGLPLRHPFYERKVPVILGEHVTLESGTGAVHTAPGSWPGRLRGRAAIRAAGRQSRRRRRPLRARDAAVRGRAGVRGEPARGRGARAERASCCSTRAYRHSYPHCWRHKTPVIFRATPQWFISMEVRRGCARRRWARSARYAGHPSGASSASRA